MKELCHKKRGRPLLLGELDNFVKDHVTELRKGGGVLNRNIVIATARGIVKYENKALLSENWGPIQLDRGWSDSFLSRLGYVKREGTKAARKLPSDFDEKKEDFLTGVGGVIEEKNIPPELVINFDQTGVKIVPVSN